MIPISLFPKRFAAALGRSRGGLSNLSFRAQSKPLSTIYTSPPPSGSTSLPAKHLEFSTVAKLQEIAEEDVITRVATLKSTIDHIEHLSSQRTQAWWTGKAPAECLGFDSRTASLHSIGQVCLAPGLISREALQNYFDNTWTLTETLFAGLKGEDAFMVSPYHDLRHPLIFYYGHPATLYINKLRVAGLLEDPINPYFEDIFETGVDEMSWDDLSKNKMNWPSVAEVTDYRRKAYNVISNLIQSMPEEEVQNIDMKSPYWALVMGFEHERIHLETSSVLINELPLKYVSFPKHFPRYHASVKAGGNRIKKPVKGVHYPANEMVAVPAQDVTVGKPENFPSFGWDNEYGQRTYSVPGFKASKFKITNGEFLEFVKDNGYARDEVWTADGWKWRSFRNNKWPVFWQRVGPQGLHEYDLRLLYDVVPMAWDFPVSINLHEATAYAKWMTLKSGKEMRVMTELEHHSIRDPMPSTELGFLEDPVLFNSPDQNTNLKNGSQSPVNEFKPNSKGFYDVLGNSWEWTMDYFSALPGFKIHPLYEDFSTPCFDGRHNVIMSGSFISTGDQASYFSRFHFRPHFLQHASFRLVEPNPEAPFVTSDTDAPGPYRGTNYPFRKSLSSPVDSA